MYIEREREIVSARGPQRNPHVPPTYPLIPPGVHHSMAACVSGTSQSSCYNCKTLWFTTIAEFTAQ